MSSKLNRRLNLRKFEFLTLTMPTYKCFKCGKKIKDSNLDKRFVCTSCGGKIFYKPRTKVKKIKAE